MEEKPRIKIRLRMVIVKNGKLLVTYDSEEDYYYYIGGKLEYGETVLEGTQREIKEELGEDVKLNFRKILYIRDFLQPEKDEHSLELFILGDVNKYEELEHYPDPEHGDKKWSTWLDINKLPDNLFPKPLTKKLQEDFEEGFINSGEYVGRMDGE
ncbi:MAG: NUDIX domain-containing protein [Candidatus Woesebacteria bacterium]|nr:NUDIX domain-containing protein [Candidatus Woesebacteria bacterium]